MQDEDDDDDEGGGTFLTGLGLEDDHERMLREKEEDMRREIAREEAEAESRRLKEEREKKEQQSLAYAGRRNNKPLRSDLEVLDAVVESTQFTRQDCARFKNIFIYEPLLKLAGVRQFFADTRQRHWSMLADRFFVVFNVSCYKGGVCFEDFVTSLTNLVHGPPAKKAEVWFKVMNVAAFPSKALFTDWKPKIGDSDDDELEQDLDNDHAEKPLTPHHMEVTLMKVFQVSSMAMTLRKAGQSLPAIQKRIKPQIAKVTRAFFHRTANNNSMRLSEFVRLATEQPSLLSVFDFRYPARAKGHTHARRSSIHGHYGQHGSHGHHASKPGHGHGHASHGSPRASLHGRRSSIH